MRLLIFFILCFYASSFCCAQQNNSIIGNWKVVALMGSEFYYHFDKDSTVLNNELKATLETAKKDTIEAISVIKFSMRIFENSFFYFKKDSTYKTIIGKAAPEEGTFSVDILNNKIMIFANSNAAIKKEEVYYFTFENNKLQLTMPLDNDDLIFYLEKL